MGGSGVLGCPSSPQPQSLALANDTSCNATSSKCTKLACDCGTARGGDNCGANCPHPIQICTEDADASLEVCDTSQCGARPPTVDHGAARRPAPARARLATSV